MKGPNKEAFIAIYAITGNDYGRFNEESFMREQDSISVRTFRRRCAAWIKGADSNPRPEDGGPPSSALVADERPVAGGTIHAPDKKRSDLRGRRFVFTAAQNNTFVHEEFWDSLQVFCEERGAQLVVGKFRYNKSGFQNHTKDKDNDLWFDPKVIPYVLDESLRLEAALNGTVWCGELDILPTAANPLTGLDSYTHTASSIIPHAKVQLKSVPVLRGDPIKMLYTTGACTQRNYIQRKAGQKAAFHHVFGALYVEIDDDGNEFCRQLIADSKGEFYDLTEHFTPEGVSTASVEAINWGDIHAEKLDPIVAESAWSNPELRKPDSMLDVLQPAYQFIHDLTDFTARNHHNIKNPHFLAETHFADTGNVHDGMVAAGNALQALNRPWCKTVVVESNHDQAFRRWLSEADIRQDPENAEYFHTYNAKIYAAIREGNPKLHIFEEAVREDSTLENTEFLDEDDSFVICGQNGIECGMHGHRGPNGSRGTANGLRALGRKCNVGHAHSAGIIDGIYTAGISCKMDLGYNKGPSSWSQSHIITYRSGKRAIITMKNGKWRA